ncbi:MAG: hypothetical protein AAFR87_02390 [Bacteroidota bacterium]
MRKVNHTSYFNIHSAMNTSYQENRTISYLISMLLVTAYYLCYLWEEFQKGTFETDTIPSEWGWTVLKLIAAQIVLSVFASIGVSIIYAILNREMEKEVSDERDKLFELKTNQLSFTMFGLGFLSSMLCLGLGTSPLLVLNLIVLSIFVGSMVGYVAKLYFYRRGY